MIKTNMYCTLDTETVGGASTPSGIYHLGGIIHNRQGEIIGCFNYVIAEHFDEIKDDDYAKKNFDLYLAMLEDGTATLIATEDEAVTVVDHLLKFYNVNILCAFNSGFDFCKTSCRNLLEGREFIDIWLMALQTLAIRKKFVKFCADNGRYNKKGTCKTNAETMYAYLMNNPTYCEEHTALEDSKIELQILLACFKSHKAFTKNCHCFDFADKWALFPRV